MLFILHPGKQYPVSIISQINKPIQFITKTVFKRPLEEGIYLAEQNFIESLWRVTENENLTDTIQVLYPLLSHEL